MRIARGFLSIIFIILISSCEVLEIFTHVLDRYEIRPRDITERNRLIAYHIDVVIKLIRTLNSIRENRAVAYFIAVGTIDKITVIDVIVSAEERNDICLAELCICAVIFISAECLLSKLSLPYPRAVGRCDKLLVRILIFTKRYMEERHTDIVFIGSRIPIYPYGVIELIVVDDIVIIIEAYEMICI